MLQLINIKKDYIVADEKVQALKGISLRFRKNEFVSILGASGCGKTTLLNIIGGLDHYTSGDLVIEGVSTKSYSDRDWDTYRNHSIGFIFQSYHLVPHQTVLQNVELALMISGVSKRERRRRAIEALDKVGLKSKINNRPNQLSGGQAQRVAIARALINDPEIVLADEPTGALDSTTSVQIMELLKEISKDRLVIMVTHNPELAEQYSTRIIRLKDGLVQGDNMPYSGEDQPQVDLNDKVAQKNLRKKLRKEKAYKGKKKQSSMPLNMAMSLSLKNLLSKGKRTAMVSVAGSIGIVGVSMVLAISSGVQGYIQDMENDMLSGYPVSITQSAFSFDSLMDLSGGSQKVDIGKIKEGDKVYVNSLLETLGTFSTGFQKTNKLTPEYLDYISKIPAEQINVLQYSYSFQPINNIYTDLKVSDRLSEKIGADATGKYNGGEMSITAIRAMYGSVLSHVEEYKQWGSMISTVSTFSEIPNNFDYIMSQYDVLAIDRNGEVVTESFSDGELKTLFEDKNSLIMVLSHDKIDDLTLAQYGYFTEDEFLDYAFKGVRDDETSESITLVGEEGLPYSTFVGDGAKKFTYYPNDVVYTKATYGSQPKYSDAELQTMLTGLMKLPAPVATTLINARNQGDAVLDQTLKGMGLSGSQYDTMYQLLHRPSADETTTGFIANAYTTQSSAVIEGETFNLPAFQEKSAYNKRVEMGVKLILQKKQNISYGCLNSGFYYTKALTDYILDTEQSSEIVKYVQDNGALDNLPLQYQYYYVETTDGVDRYVLNNGKGQVEGKSSSMMASMIGDMTGASTSYDAALFGGSRIPDAVFIYPKNFDTKNDITAYLDAWNDMCKNNATYTFNGTEIALTEGEQITYTDTVGLIIGMVNTMIQMITIALIAFTALSLVVSTVMIGIITYVSVVERVKEIGILRAVGARKKDIKRLFNAETFMIGLGSGIIGIAVTYVLSLIINFFVGIAAGIFTIAALPWYQAVIMVAISVILTLISGLIPASSAAKKDPVIALRTE